MAVRCTLACSGRCARGERYARGGTRLAYNKTFAQTWAVFCSEFRVHYHSYHFLDFLPITVVDTQRSNPKIRRGAPVPAYAPGRRFCALPSIRHLVAVSSSSNSSSAVAVACVLCAVSRCCILAWYLVCLGPHPKIRRGAPAPADATHQGGAFCALPPIRHPVVRVRLGTERGGWLRVLAAAGGVQRRPVALVRAEGVRFVDLD